ncbi:MAG: hypothetical protein R2797_02915 [Gelidibacter sp.]
MKSTEFLIVSDNMKTQKLVFTFVLALIAFVNVYSQTQQKIDMKIDAIGNSQITVSMTMNAQQWQTWLQTMGNNPAAMKREIERSMPAYFLDDFKLEKKDMERSFVLTLNAYGACEVDKRGNWTIDTDQKNANVTELTDHKFMLVSSPPELGGNVQQTYTIEFPEEAENIKIDKDAYGKSVFKFKMENSSANFNIMRWAGVLLLLVGAAWFVKNVVQK